MYRRYRRRRCQQGNWQRQPCWMFHKPIHRHRTTCRRRRPSLPQVGADSLTVHRAPAGLAFRRRRYPVHRLGRAGRRLDRLHNHRWQEPQGRRRYRRHRCQGCYRWYRWGGRVRRRSGCRRRPCHRPSGRRCRRRPCRPVRHLRQAGQRHS